MEDKKKVKRFRPMTTDKLGKIKKLMTKGLNSREIADMIDIGESTAKRYMSILAAICDGQRIPVPPEQYNSSIVKEFCETHGIEYRHVSNEQKPERAPETPMDAVSAWEPDGAGEQLPGQMSVEDIELDAQIAVFKREEQGLMKAIYSYVWELIKLYNMPGGRRDDA